MSGLSGLAAITLAMNWLARWPMSALLCPAVRPPSPNNPRCPDDLAKPVCVSSIILPIASVRPLTAVSIFASVAFSRAFIALATSGSAILVNVLRALLSLETADKWAPTCTTSNKLRGSHIARPTISTPGFSSSKANSRGSTPD